MNPPPNIPADKTGDTELMLRFKQQHDQEAFSELVRRHQKSLINFFYRLVWNREKSEDLAQEVFIKLIKNIHTYEPKAKFTTFLYRIARNLWIDKLRCGQISTKVVSLDTPIDQDKQRPLSELIAEENSNLTEDIANKELVDRLKKLILGLPEEQQVILNLTYFEGMAYQEVAKIVDIPLGTVKSRLHAAIAKLKEKV